MNKLFVDIGSKNFCYLCVDNEKILDWNLISIKSLEELVEILDSINFDFLFLEKQMSINSVCIKFQTACETYCILKEKKYRLVSPKHKFDFFKVHFKNYYERKQWVISKGKEILFKKYPNSIFVDKVLQSKKKDDFFDCLLMSITEEI